jgi:hypothetical protein
MWCKVLHETLHYNLAEGNRKIQQVFAKLARSKSSALKLKDAGMVVKSGKLIITLITLIPLRTLIALITLITLIALIPRITRVASHGAWELPHQPAHVDPELSTQGL